MTKGSQRIHPGPKPTVSAPKPGRSGSAACNRRTASQSTGSPLEHVALLQRALGNHAVARLLGAGAIQAQLTTRQTGGQKKPDTDEKKAAEEKSTWSRKHTSGPRLFEGEKASYQVFFDHVLPAVPKGAKQVWQVVEVNKTVLTDKCKLMTERSFIIDVVDIGTRTAVNDSWGMIAEGDPCFVKEVNKAQIGFDDRKSNFAQQTSVRATAALAQKVLKRMTGPEGSYSGTYTFVRKGPCGGCEKELAEARKKHGAPAGEALSIAGVGDFTSEK